MALTVAATFPVTRLEDVPELGVVPPPELPPLDDAPDCIMVYVWV